MPTPLRPRRPAVFACSRKIAHSDEVGREFSTFEQKRTPDAFFAFGVEGNRGAAPLSKDSAAKNIILLFQVPFQWAWDRPSPCRKEPCLRCVER